MASDEDKAAVEIDDEGAGFRLEDFPDRVRPLMAEFDLDNSGSISASELAHAAHLLREAQDSAKKMKRLAIVVSGLLLLTLGTIFGLVWAVVSALKDTQMDDDGAMTVKGSTSQLVTTASLKNFKPMADAITPDTPDTVLDTLDKFTILGRGQATLQVTGWGKSAPDATGATKLTLWTQEGPLTIDSLGLIYTTSPYLLAMFGLNHTDDALNYVGPIDTSATGASRRLAGSGATTSAAGSSTTSSGAKAKCLDGEFEFKVTDKNSKDFGKVQCTKCPAGTLNNKDLAWTAPPGGCPFCGPWSISSAVGSAKCTPCPNGDLADKTHTKCLDPFASTWMNNWPGVGMKATDAKGWQQWKDAAKAAGGYDKLTSGKKVMLINQLKAIGATGLDDRMVILYRDGVNMATA